MTNAQFKRELYYKTSFKQRSIVYGAEKSSWGTKQKNSQDPGSFTTVQAINEIEKYTLGTPLPSGSNTQASLSEWVKMTEVIRNNPKMVSNMKLLSLTEYLTASMKSENSANSGNPSVEGDVRLESYPKGRINFFSKELWHTLNNHQNG